MFSGNPSRAKVRCRDLAMFHAVFLVMRSLRLLASALFVSFGLGGSRAEIVLAPLFADHAVLQRGKPVPVWGIAAPREKITVAFAGQTMRTAADNEGRWTVSLAPMVASNEGADLVITGKKPRVVRDVVVGEVWLCSGQSNMNFPVQRAMKAAQEMATAQFPLIRQVKIEQMAATTPMTTARTTGWQSASPETVGGFTAVGYFFARDLHQKLGVPIGLVLSGWNGSSIESWMSPAALASDPAFAVINERWIQSLAEYPEHRLRFEAELAAREKDEAAARLAGPKPHAAFLKEHRRPRTPRGPSDGGVPASLFNGMINPLLPYALRGVLWYQGEANAVRAAEYHPLFAATIAAWRAHFGQSDLPFYWVQLANYKTDEDWPRLREAQAQTLALPHTGQAVAIDLGDSDDIHPTNKQEVGRRLALIARANVYGIPTHFSGPRFASAERESSALRVRFTHASGGLVAHHKPVQSLQIAGADRKFYPATAKIERDTLLVSAPEVKEPVAVRYAWSSDPEANLFDGAGLPAAPFRSDDW